MCFIAETQIPRFPRGFNLIGREKIVAKERRLTDLHSNLPGKKSGKKKKKTRHYKELAGLMAPELAALNATLTNGHGRGSGQLQGDEGTTIPYVAHQGAAGGSRNNDVREISRAESPANQRQQRGNRRSAGK